MEEAILREILQEMKGFRIDLSETNKRLDGLLSSLVIMQQAYSNVSWDVNQIKEFLKTRVIWNNDSISIETGSGVPIAGTIHKAGES